MPYMVAPGARLVVGPHGQLDETLGLGSCCPPCARGALGAMVSTESAPIIAQPGNAGIVPTSVILTAPATHAAPPARNLRPLLIIGGVAAVGALLLLRKKRR